MVVYSKRAEDDQKYSDVSHDSFAEGSSRIVLLASVKLGENWFIEMI